MNTVVLCMPYADTIIFRCDWTLIALSLCFPGGDLAGAYAVSCKMMTVGPLMVCNPAAISL